MNDKNHILITGSVHSGTTWVGQIVSSDSSVKKYFEPFNLMNGPMDHWMEYVSEGTSLEKQKLYKKYIGNLLSPNIYDSLSFAIKGIKYSGIDQVFQKKRTVLLKDPIAVFSADWLYEKFSFKVIVLIRHPAAFASSILKRDWAPSLEVLYRQNKLMDEILFNYKEEFQEFINSKERSNLVFAIHLWNAIHTRILDYQNRFNDKWYFIRHEDISKDPKAEFQKLFDWLGLEFTENTLGVIKETTGGVISDSYNTGTIRDTKSHIHFWKKYLTEEQINYVKEKTGKIATQFYSELDW